MELADEHALYDACSDGLVESMCKQGSRDNVLIDVCRKASSAQYRGACHVHGVIISLPAAMAFIS
jgi:hypothetical protein